MANALSAEQVDAMLELLSTDDDYRRLFLDDLGAALRQLPGSPNVPPDAKAGDCMCPPKLASKQVIRQTKAKLLERFTSKDAYIPKLLEP